MKPIIPSFAGTPESISAYFEVAGKQHAQTQTHRHTHTHAHRHTDTHTDTDTDTHTHTHTHTHKRGGVERDVDKAMQKGLRGKEARGGAVMGYVCADGHTEAAWIMMMMRLLACLLQSVVNRQCL